jgi:hypothetical protein
MKTPLDSRPLLRAPDPTRSYEEWLEATNQDLPDLSPDELFHEMWRAGRIAACRSRAFVWTGPHDWMTAAEWASERIRKAMRLLAESEAPGRTRPRRREVAGWLR